MTIEWKTDLENPRIYRGELGQTIYWIAKKNGKWSVSDNYGAEWWGSFKTAQNAMKAVERL